MADRERLQEVHQTDLTESRINEEFVDWLKTKGPSWLLVILLGVGGYLAILRWKQHKVAYFSEAWVALSDSRLPGAFEDVAARYADVPGMPQLAKRLGADTLLRAVQSGRPIGADPFATQATAQLTEDERAEYLNRAARLFQDVVATDDGSLSITLHIVSALQGLAVVAESRGDVEQARIRYEAAAARAEPSYPWLAEQARRRAATTDAYAAAVMLPKQADLPLSPPTDPPRPVVIDEALRDLLLPNDSGES